MRTADKPQPQSSFSYPDVNQDERVVYLYNLKPEVSAPEMSMEAHRGPIEDVSVKSLYLPKSERAVLKLDVRHHGTFSVYFPDDSPRELRRLARQLRDAADVLEDRAETVDPD